MRTTVEKIKERISIDDLIGSYVKLEKSGKNLKARCPFHNEKTPSFYVSVDRGSYYCFGCGAKGDIFTFVEQFEGLDFVGSLKLLAERAGVPLVFERQENKSLKDRLYAVMEIATVFFEKELAKSVEAKKYVEQRGIKGETVKAFRIGYAPNEWRLLYEHLKALKYSDQEIDTAGLIKRPDSTTGSATGFFDRFRGRVMFPISDSAGRVIAFSGRILVENDKAPKYLNSPETPLYNKSSVLYGIDKAKTAIRMKGYTILVEGQMDLVLSHQAGITNTVAASGTALSDSTLSRDNIVNNLGIVRRLSENVIIAFDSDLAGRKATMRAARVALSLGMDVKVADLPEGKDPADLVLNSPDDWKNILRKTKPVIEFVIDMVMKKNSENGQNSDKRGSDKRKIPAQIRSEVLPFVSSLPSSMEKSFFIKMINEKTGIDEASIWEDLKKVDKDNAEAERVALASKKDVPGAVPVVPGVQLGAVIVAGGPNRHLDIVSRRLFGIAYKEKKDEILTKMKSIAGEALYMELLKDGEERRDELILEAEVLYGNVNIDREVDELLLSFEEDCVREDFTKAMAELQRSERSTDKKESEKLLKRCKELSEKLSEILKKKSK